MSPQLRSAGKSALIGCVCVCVAIEGLGIMLHRPWQAALVAAGAVCVGMLCSFWSLLRDGAGRAILWEHWRQKG
jgi:hypothetical protein